MPVLLTDHKWRPCQPCIDEHHRKWPHLIGRVSFGNTHKLRHSALIGACVDEGIYDFLEGFNRDVAPTFASCEGDRSNDSYVMVAGEHQQAVLAWLPEAVERYGHCDLGLYPSTSELHRVRLSFSATPTAWLG